MATTSSPSLSFLWLEITSKCNLECLHCYSDASPRQNLLGSMSAEQWFRVIREAAALGCRQVQFIGGEPTLHPHLIDMILFAKQERYAFIEIFTNATVLQETLLGVIKDNAVHVASSFYSDDPNVHDAITHHHGSFKRTVSNIQIMLSAGIPVRVGIIETNLNAGHVVRAEELLRSIGVSQIHVDIQRKVGRGAQLLPSSDPCLELCGDCSNGKLCVTASGETFPCVFSRFAPLGHVNAGITTIVSSKALGNFRQQLSVSLTKRDQAVNQQQNFTHTNKMVCGPDVICNPDIQCTPNCTPGSSKCVPSLSPCNPSVRCLPVQRYEVHS